MQIKLLWILYLSDVYKRQVLGAAGIVVALSMLANVIVQGETVSDFTYYVSLVIILVVTVAAYMGSYAISAMIYKKVER